MIDTLIKAIMEADLQAKADPEATESGVPPKSTMVSARRLPRPSARRYFQTGPRFPETYPRLEDMQEDAGVGRRVLRREF
jgi:hypothetical protein